MHLRHLRHPLLLATLASTKWRWPWEQHHDGGDGTIIGPKYEEPFPRCRCRGLIPPGLSQGPDLPDTTRTACHNFSRGTYRNGIQEYVKYNEDLKECNPDPVGIEPSYWDEVCKKDGAASGQCWKDF
ncbi:hypothetical protein Tdes44962_MAKER03663 [Teratosphaeria destructans]|uniref:Uncharacterized protein n=1 Tax=Teratosphaeria destructans TaxID=418781 RepID=A0A9W7W112_9PEZI|nr:hypothetical protein Tdes44962_MAKER03663 [Teratosphaeria destructans]